MSGSGGFDTSQVTVQSSGATLIAARRPGRNAITIINRGTVPVEIGNSSAVTTGAGAELPGVAGASLTIPTQAEVWGIAESATQSVSVVETY
jgi:hypothetical protein